MKNILVTGGSRGIGKEIVKTCIKEGCYVHFTYANDLSSAKQMHKKINSSKLSFSRCDLNNVEDITKLFESLKNSFQFIDGLVNNAGISGGNLSIKEFPSKTIDEVLSVNVKGLLVCCKEVIPLMSIKNGARGGSIVNISSMASTIGGRPGRTLYATSKGAVDVFTIGAAKELAPDKIRVNAVRPGVIKTDMVKLELDGDEHLETHYAKSIPFKRFGEPLEVAELVFWLLSDKSSFVSGSRLDVSGGGFII